MCLLYILIPPVDEMFFTPKSASVQSVTWVSLCLHYDCGGLTVPTCPLIALPSGIEVNPLPPLEQ